jgi:peptidoglycan endopeptidase LytF
MDSFTRYELKQLNQQTNEYVLVVYLDDQLTEFAAELGTKPQTRERIRTSALQLITAKYPDIKVTVVKVMVGGMMVSSLPVFANAQSASETSTASTQSTQTSSIYYHAAPGDTLWTISRAFNKSVDQIKRANNITSDTLQLNQRLIIPKAFHTVAAGDYLSVLARDYNTTAAAIREANNLDSDQVRLGQMLIIPAVINQGETAPQPAASVPSSQSEATSNTYSVLPGDSLSVIAKKFSTTTKALRSANSLSSDVIFVGQTLKIPTSASNSGGTSGSKVQTIDSVYTVVSGDNLSVLAKRFGTSVDALRSANSLNSDVLQIGQRLVIPGGNTNLTPPSDAQPAPSETASSYIVVSGDNLSVIAKRFGTTDDRS